MIKLKGIYLIKRSNYGNNVELMDTKKRHTTIDYFEFKSFLTAHFLPDTIDKILDHINCSKKVIVDFDKDIAKRVVEKDYDFSRVINEQLDAKKIQMELDDPYSLLDADIYSKFSNL